MHPLLLLCLPLLLRHCPRQRQAAAAEAQPLLPFECHEHNYGLVNILKAARAAEKKGAGCWCRRSALSIQRF